MPKLNVDYLNQMPQWPTGCESVSTVMALNYLNVPIEVEQFITKYLPCKKLDGTSGKLKGPDPRQYFVGDPHQSTGSYGCYAPVIVKVVNKVMDDYHQPYQTIDATGISTEQLCQQQLAAGRPVIYWCTIDFKESEVSTQWQLDDGSIFDWRSNEHCLLLIGQDDDYYWCADPWNGHGIITVDRQLLEDRHHMMLDMAVVIEPKGENR